MFDLPGKIPNILTLIRERASTGDFVVLPHAATRRQQRNISIPDITFILIHGEREPNKDEYKHDFQSWNYAIKGKTVDSKAVRIAVTFDEDEMLIVTVIPLGKRRK
ncbi:MAG: DUF4258 domain-containing protein [Oligoflexales bacterium]